jgi:ubiquinone/menaquinone biosynthesis C-methylase UbiE
MHHSGNDLINPFRVLERAGIGEGMRVADLGCGALGHFVFPAAQLVGTSGMVYAVDIQKVALQSIGRIAQRENYLNVETVWSDIDVINATRIDPHSLDLTIIANNLFLSTNRGGLIEEAVRLTKPGGRLLVIEWEDRCTTLGPPMDHRIGSEAAKIYFDRPDLRLVDQFEAGDCHYALVYNVD